MFGGNHCQRLSNKLKANMKREGEDFYPSMSVNWFANCFNPAGYLLSVDSLFIEDRRKSLRRWLTLVARHPALNQDPLLNFFLTYTGPDLQHKIREVFRRVPDEFTTSELAAKAKELVPLDTHTEFANSRDQIRVILNGVSRLKQIADILAQRSHGYAADMTELGSQLSALASEPHGSSLWATGGNRVWADMKRGFHIISKECTNAALCVCVESALMRLCAFVESALMRLCAFVESALMRLCAFVESALMRLCAFVESALMRLCAFVESALMRLCAFVESALMRLCAFVESALMRLCAFVESALMRLCAFVESALMRLCAFVESALMRLCAFVESALMRLCAFVESALMRLCAFVESALMRLCAFVESALMRLCVLYREFALLSSHASQQATREEDEVCEKLNLLLDVLVAHRELCDRHEKGVAQDHAKALAKMLALKKRQMQGVIQGTDAESVDQLESKMMDQENVIANMELRNYFSLHCLHMETQLVHAHLEILATVLSTLVSVQIRGHSEVSINKPRTCIGSTRHCRLADVWAQIQPTVEKCLPEDSHQVNGTGK
uniref:PX domain-containing protein n=1 Tax=Timema shepardi TaxID=629360 RepID=A0A7R9AZ81_TIMSH|nr:unnamed protein product [Timema shepardi]